MRNASIFTRLALAALLLVGGARVVRADGKPANAYDASLDAAREAAKGDALLEALLTELDRSKSQLKMDQVQPPYYIEYRVNDVDNYSAEAAFGALRESDRSHLRFLRVVVRIGDYKQDSFYSQGIGSGSILPLDNDPIALRRQIWLLTDEAYKSAADAYAEKLSALKQFTPDANPIDDFARAPVVSDVGETVSLQVDSNEWDKTLQDVTDLYRQYPGIQSVDASARFTAVNEYLVNSEGTIVRQGRTTATVTLSSSSQASDGMRLGRSPFWTEQRPEQLPSRAELLKE